MTANVSVFNTRRQRSVTVDWTIQSRTERVILKMINLNAAKAKAPQVLWMDRELRYFVSSCLVRSPVEAIERKRRRKEGDVTRKLWFQIEIPQIFEN